MVKPRDPQNPFGGPGRPKPLEGGAGAVGPAGRVQPSSLRPVTATEGGLFPQAPRSGQVIGPERLSGERLARTPERQSTPRGSPTASSVVEQQRTARQAEREKPVEREPPARGDFMGRRAEQLRQERSRERKEDPTDPGVAAAGRAIEARRTERQQVARQYIQSRRGPREVTPDLKREMQAERRLGLEPRSLQMDVRGLVTQPAAVRGAQFATTFTDPRTGATRVSVRPQEGLLERTIPGTKPQPSIAVPFRSRTEALEWLATRPNVKQARAKEALQMQRLGLRTPFDLFTE